MTSLFNNEDRSDLSRAVMDGEGERYWLKHRNRTWRKIIAEELTGDWRIAANAILAGGRVIRKFFHL